MLVGEYILETIGIFNLMFGYNVLKVIWWYK
jgi:hypothetical protein